MTTRLAGTSSGLGIEWGAEHRDGDGNLISRQAVIPVPAVPKCITPKCLWKYVFDRELSDEIPQVYGIELNKWLFMKGICDERAEI